MSAEGVALPRRPDGTLDMRRYPHGSDLVGRYVWHGRVEGRMQGTATAVLRVLGARGVAVAADVHLWISGSTDLLELEELLRRAVTAESIDDVLGVAAELGSFDGERGAVPVGDRLAAASAVAARRRWEEHVDLHDGERGHPLVRRFVSAGRCYGRLDAAAWAISTVLQERAVEVPETVRTAINSCDDPAQLNVWLGRALTARSIQDVVDPVPV